MLQEADSVVDALCNYLTIVYLSYLPIDWKYLTLDFDSGRVHIARPIPAVMNPAAVSERIVAGWTVLMRNSTSGRAN